MFVPWGHLRHIIGEAGGLVAPSAWRVVFDGVTLRTEATIVLVVVACTNADGQIVVELLGGGGTPPGPRSTGGRLASGHVVIAVLEETLAEATATKYLRAWF